MKKVLCVSTFAVVLAVNLTLVEMCVSVRFCPLCRDFELRFIRSMMYDIEWHSFKVVSSIFLFLLYFFHIKSRAIVTHPFTVNLAKFTFTQDNGSRRSLRDNWYFKVSLRTSTSLLVSLSNFAPIPRSITTNCNIYDVGTSLSFYTSSETDFLSRL